MLYSPCRAPAGSSMPPPGPAWHLPGRMARRHRARVTRPIGTEMSHLTFLEAAVVGLIQGVSEMFPVSSLGHNVLIPALVGGSWARDLNVATPESPYLAFIVGLHVATAVALLVYFWRDW